MARRVRESWNTDISRLLLNVDVLGSCVSPSTARRRDKEDEKRVSFSLRVGFHDPIIHAPFHLHTVCIVNLVGTCHSNGHSPVCRPKPTIQQTDQPSNVISCS